MDGIVGGQDDRIRPERRSHQQSVERVPMVMRQLACAVHVFAPERTAVQ